MRSFIGRDILSLKEFERSEFLRIFEIAERLEPSRAIAATATCSRTKRS